MVSVDVKQHWTRAEELCESPGGCPGLPVPNSPSGLCGHKASSPVHPAMTGRLTFCSINILLTVVPSRPRLNMMTATATTATTSTPETTPMITMTVVERRQPSVSSESSPQSLSPLHFSDSEMHRLLSHSNSLSSSQGSVLLEKRFHTQSILLLYGMHLSGGWEVWRGSGCNRLVSLFAKLH